MMPRKKPEWQAMYQDLVDQHRHHPLGRTDARPHRIMADDLLDLDAAVEWCIANLDLCTWSWGVVGDPTGDVACWVFSFDRAEDAVLFGLSWG